MREKTFGNNNAFNFVPRHKNYNYFIRDWLGYIDEATSYLLGLIIGDNCQVSKKQKSCVITSSDKEVQDFLLNNYFFEFDKKGNELVSRQGKYIIEFLEQLGFDFGKKTEKSIPPRLLRMSRKNISALMRGLFDSNGNSTAHYGSIEFASTSSKLIEQVKQVLDMFGIQVSDEFQNHITLSRYFSKLFYEKIGFSINRKQEKYEMVKNVELYEQSYPGMKEWIEFNLFKKHDVWNNEISRTLNFSCSSAISRNKLSEVFELCKKYSLTETEEYKKLLDFYEKDYFLLKVRKIENSKNHTYDFVIPDTHSFYANGVITHNTPNGTSGAGSYYYSQVQEAKQELYPDTKYLEIEWWEVPDDDRIAGPKKGYNDILQKAINENYFYNKAVKEKYKKYFEPISKAPENNLWLKASLADLGHIKFKQEILHEFVIDGDRVFGPDTIAALEKKVKEPISKDYLFINDEATNTFKVWKEQRGVWIWKHPIPGHRYSLSCLPVGEEVITDNGLVPVECITGKEKLYDREGNFTNIKNIQISPYNGKTYSIKAEGVFDATTFTEEHPIWASTSRISRPVSKEYTYRKRILKHDFKWKNASEVKVGDWLEFPNIYRGKELSEEEILAHTYEKYKPGRKDFELPKEFFLDEEVWWYIGLWLAEGYTEPNSKKYKTKITTCHNLKTEKWVFDKIKAMMARYGRKCSCFEEERCSSLNIFINSSQLTKFFDTELGKGAKNKRIPEWMKFLPDNLKKQLVKGYLLGDGSVFTANRRKDRKITFVSISKELLKGFQDILYSLGFISSLNILAKKGYKFVCKQTCYCQEKYSLIIGFHDTIKLCEYLEIEQPDDVKKLTIENRYISHNHFSKDLSKIYLKVASVSENDYFGMVYNFETEAHEFMCNYIPTHNCDVSSGTSSDTSTIQVLDIDDGIEQVLEFKGFISTSMFSKLIKDVARIYNDAYVVIECNSIGDAVFNGVYYSENDPYGNIYKQKKTKNGITRYTSWITDVKTRKLMVSTVIDWITVPDLFDKLNLYSSRLLEEFKTWVWVSQDKAMHADNCVAGDTIITCKDGFKKIKDIKPGEYVLTENGTFERVCNTFKIKDDRKRLMEIEAYGMPKLKITSTQKILTFKDGRYAYVPVGELTNDNYLYSRFSDFSGDFSVPVQTEIEGKFDLYQIELNQENLYSDRSSQLAIIEKMLKNNYFRYKKGNYVFSPKKIEYLYFVSHLLYRNRIVFSMANNKITISSSELSKHFSFINDDKIRNSRTLFKDKFGSKIKSIKDCDDEIFLYDIEVEGFHSYVANGYIVHNCHDDAIMALSLGLYLRDKAAGSNTSVGMFIAEDGSVISYDREKFVKDAAEEGKSYSTITSTGRTRYGSSPSGIMSSNEKEFEYSSDERKFEDAFGEKRDVVKWLLS